LGPDSLLLATRSADKVREIREILGPTLAARIRDLHDAALPEDEAENDLEAFDTFLANAHAKASYFAARSGLPVIAEDSGLCVDALGGAPGVRSRRWAARPDLHGRDLDRANNERLLTELGELPIARRTAHYTCAAVVHLPGGQCITAVGTCSGFILHQPRGAAGFGYDPLFLDPATGLSFGETDPTVKNRRSHRAAAFRALAANLRF
jgi:XTP/dITP diphosphohydrolase